MPNEPYEKDGLNAEAAGTEAAGTDTYEEFDISSFDFTIADPGDEGEYAPTPEKAEGESEEGSAEASRTKKKKKKFSFSDLSEAISEKAAKLMEESPREKTPKQRPRRESEIREPQAAGSQAAESAVPLQKEPKGPRERKKFTLPFTKGSFSQVSRRWLRYALRPATLYENINENYWPLFLVGIMLYFAAFYLLIGLDWYFADLVSAGRLWAVAGVGLLVGGTAATVLAAGAQGLSLICRKERIRPFRTFAPLAGACVYPSSLLILGFLLRIVFRISVSMSFGVISILWMIYNVLEGLREQFGEKNLFKCAGLTVLWGLILFAVMTLTFTLK